MQKEIQGRAWPPALIRLRGEAGCGPALPGRAGTVPTENPAGPAKGTMWGCSACRVSGLPHSQEGRGSGFLVEMETEDPGGPSDLGVVTRF